MDLQESQLNFILLLNFAFFATSFFYGNHQTRQRRRSAYSKSYCGTLVTEIRTSKISPQLSAPKASLRTARELAGLS